MKGSLIIVGFFVLGLILGLYVEPLSLIAETQISKYILYTLMFAVGISVGCDKDMIKAIRSQNIKVLILPLGTVVATLLGALIVFPLLSNITLPETLAVASGFGYYSLSSIMLTEYKGAEIGAIALIANVSREILTLLIAPLLVKYFGKLSIISCAGVTSIDTLLPIVTKLIGANYIVISILHGLIIELCVPILVTIFASI